MGNISINDKKIDELYFGGPAIIEDRFIYIPLYVKKFLKSGFQLSKIDVNNGFVETIGDLKSLIFLKEKIGNTIFFFEDVQQQKVTSITIS